MTTGGRGAGSDQQSRTPGNWILALGCAAALLFATVALSASTSDTTPGDVWLTQRLQSIDSPVFARPLDETEDLAQAPILIWVTLAAPLAFLFWGGLRAGVVMALAPAMRFLSPVLKDLIERPRPSPSLAEVHGQPADFSFPSGHALNAMLVYGLAFYLAAVCIPNRWVRLPVQIFCAWVITASSLERVYVGHHWPSDVAGGLLLGLAVLAPIMFFWERWKVGPDRRVPPRLRRAAHRA